MEWLLLYPIIGLGLGIYYAIHYHKHGHSDDATVALVIVMVVLWPIGWWPSERDIRGYRAEALETGAKEHEALLERVRREDRARTRREFAEFDRELGIEPEGKKAHPSAANEYEYIGKRQGGRPLRIPVVECIDEAQYRVKDIAPTSWDEEQLAQIEYTKRLGKMILNRSLPNYSKGGRV